MELAGFDVQKGKQSAQAMGFTLCITEHDAPLVEAAADKRYDDCLPLLLSLDLDELLQEAGSYCRWPSRGFDANRLLKACVRRCRSGYRLEYWVIKLRTFLRESLARSSTLAVIVAEKSSVCLVAGQ